jgi:hypothetical protein
MMHIDSLIWMVGMQVGRLRDPITGMGGNAGKKTRSHLSTPTS